MALAQMVHPATATDHSSKELRLHRDKSEQKIERRGVFGRMSEKEKDGMWEAARVRKSATWGVGGEGQGAPVLVAEAGVCGTPAELEVTHTLLQTVREGGLRQPMV